MKTNRKKTTRKKASRKKPARRAKKKKTAKRVRKAKAKKPGIEPPRISDPLLEELIDSGILNEAMLGWARAHSVESGVPLDTALLELDLIDEEGLLCGLESCYQITAARPGDLIGMSPQIGKTLPKGFSQTFSLCPLRLSGNRLVALVESPLPQETVEELGSLFNLEPRQLVAPSHYLALAREKVYDIPVDSRTRELEAKLARRRGAAEVKYLLASVSSDATLTSAIADILDFAACLLDFSCFLERSGDELRVVTVQESRLSHGESFALPETDCSLGAALRHGGYFVGPVAGTRADQRLYQALGHPPPRWGMLVPVPATGDTRMSFYADNGPRGIATSWVAKLTLLTSRLGHLGIQLQDSLPEESAASFEEAFEKLLDQPSSQEVSEPEDDQPTRDELTVGEQAAMVRLRQAAAEAGMTVDALVEDLLRERSIRPASEDGEDAAALVGEIKELFEKLASDIPTQLARGMETAFRGMAPRLAASPGSQPESPRAASVGLVRKEAGKREVPSYRSRRRKTKRVKL